ncbi:MAG: T9SS type A sorting domain-containing protein [Cytophagaceae bacterium]
MKKLYSTGIFSKLLILLSISGLSVFAQSPYSLTPDWYFGVGGRLTFPNGNFATSGAPAVGSKGTNTSASPETSTSISHPDGSVAIYTNTMQVYNGNPAATAWTDFIRNLNATGDNTCGGSATGGGIAFPDPAAANAYYLVIANDLTSGACANRGSHRYRFTGAGTATGYNAGPTLMADNAFAAEAITAGSDGNGGYYLVLHDKGSANVFRVWRFTSGGITGPTDYDKPDFFSNADFQSYLKISPCQDKIAFAGGNALVVYEFDRTTGAVGNELRRVAGIGQGVGLEFSPDGSRVFYSGQGTTVNYVNIATGATGSVAGSASWTMQLGPDGKIYTSGTQGSTVIGVITDPNGTPSYSTLAMAGGTNMFRGISNIAWLSPRTPAINNSGSCNLSFNFDFNTYFGSAVAVNAATIEWNFGTGLGWQSGLGATPTFDYTSAGTGTYTVQVRYRDSYCNHLWTASKSVSPVCTAPVTLVAFDGYRSGSKNILHWSTASEINNSHFIIQRSSDGENFETIGKVDGNGNSNIVRHYAFTDYQTGNENYYYRLVQFDFDGKNETSKVISISSGSSAISVQPNPSAGEFHLAAYKAGQIKVTDILGRVLMEKYLTDELNVMSFGSELTKGTYLLIFADNEQTHTILIVKE